MKIETSNIIEIFTKIFKEEVSIDFDVPLLESGLRLESLRIMRILIEIENLINVSLPQEDAFELFSLSVNQLTERLNSILTQSLKE